MDEFLKRTGIKASQKTLHTKIVNEKTKLKKN